MSKLTRQNDSRTLVTTHAMLPVNPQTLLPVCQEIWHHTNSGLAPAEAARWQVNRVVQPHGTRRTVLLWRVWDRRCRAHGLDHRYFCWCLNYDPEHYYNRETHWQLQLYINTIRLYRHADALRRLLPARLRSVCPPGFRFLTDDHSVQLVWNFAHADALSGLPRKVIPMLTAALTATAPVFDEVFALLQAPAPRALALSRPAARPVANPAVPNPGGSLSRNISPALRRQVLQRSDNRCSLCGVAFAAGDEIHIDHIRPWAKGGLSVVDNLQATHAACNLAKGAQSR